MFLCESGLASVVSPLVRTRNWGALKGPGGCPILTSLAASPSPRVLCEVRVGIFPNITNPTTTLSTGGFERARLQPSPKSRKLDTALAAEGANLRARLGPPLFANSWDTPLVELGNSNCRGRNRRSFGTQNGAAQGC